ncbi:BQ2448_8136 [Microbotryum intermedium]|uniref:BQ2448_8136 protein n=1 Tax=Microbotryum intermedium TaxID=269621 RepID=A0A238FMV4_9BASI|nr:BQ2448_8136 [Microbotryum intermedium]
MSASRASSRFGRDEQAPPTRRVNRMTRLSFGSLPSDSDDDEEDREIEWVGLKDFFLATFTDSNIDTMLVPEIVWEVGNPTLKSQRRILSFQEETKHNLYNPNAFPEMVLLTHEAFEASPNIEATWTSADDDKGDDSHCGTQIAAFAAFDPRPIDASPDSELVYGPKRLRQFLRMLASHSIRSHAFGFHMHGKYLEIVLHTPSSRFCSPMIIYTEANGYLSIFLARLLSLSDRELGIIASLCNDALSTSHIFPSSALPSRPTRFQEHLRGSPRLGNIQSLEPLYCSDSMFGRRTSAFRVLAGGEGSTAHAECAMTVSFVEEVQCNEDDRIRLAISNSSPEDRQGLTNIVDGYRESDFTIVPQFLRGGLDAKAWGLKPRAMEVTFHEQCFEPICVVDSIEALVTALVGAVQDLRNLDRLRILHRDVSAWNIMVASDGTGILINYDTAVFMDGPQRGAWALPFRARDLVEGDPERAPFLHQPWLDIESLVYVIVFVVSIQPKGPDDPSGMSEHAKSTWWEQWNVPNGVVVSKDQLLFTPQGLQYIFEPYKEFWKNVLELVSTVAKYCGLGFELPWYDRVDEPPIIEPRWATGELLHDRLITDLNALIEDIARRKERESEAPTIEGVEKDAF